MKKNKRSNNVTTQKQPPELDATKIGRALGLRGAELQEFVSMDGGAEKLLREFRQYPPEVLNLLPSLLRDAGIRPHDIRACFVRPDLGDGPVADAVLVLPGRMRMYIRLEVWEE